MLDQQEIREELAERAGMPIGAEYADPDHSGFYEERIPPAFAAMLDVLPQWGGLVVYHPDRITRHPAVAEQLIRVFKANPHLTFLCDGDAIDLSTDDGRQDLREAVGKAHRESLANRRRTSRKQRRLRESGKPTSKRGFGVGVRRADGKFDQSQLNEPECALIRQAVNDILAGRSQKSITDQWNVEGVRTAQGSYWTHNGLARMLRNPRLAGWRTVNDKKTGKAVVYVSERTGKPVRAIHPPIIDQDTYDQLQVALKKKSRAVVNAENRSGEANLLASLGQCGKCWATLHYGAGDLKCSKRGCISIVAGPVEQWITDKCLARWAEPFAETEPVAEPFAGQEELDRLESKRSKTMALFHADALTPDELAEALAPIRERIAELEAERRRWIGRTARAKAAVTNPLERWHESFANPDGLIIRREMIRSALKHFVVTPSKRTRGDDGQFGTDLTRVSLIWMAEDEQP